MKFSLLRETLLKPLQSVIGVVERRQTLPILSNVLLDIKEKRLSITGTDLEIELIGQAHLDRPDNHAGKITIPGRKLMDICKALPEGAPVELYQDKGQVILRSGRSSFTLSTLPAEDFPNFDENAGHLSFELPKQDLRYLLQRTHFAMAQQDVRYYLNGMLFEIQPGTLRTVATDGHRMACNSVAAPVEESHRIQIIVPRKGVLELMRLLDGGDNNVTLILGNNSLRVIDQENIFTTKLIEGRFPDYERVIPKDAKHSLVIDRDVLRQALSRTAILCNEKLRGIRIELRPGLLRVLANNSEQELAQEEVSIESTLDQIDMGFNVNYLLDILNCLNSGSVRLSFSGTNSSLRIEEVEGAGNSVFVVMPMLL